MDLLIKAFDNFSLDPVLNRQGAYKRGDIVLVRPTGLPWGKDELIPPAQGGHFVRVTLLRDDGLTPCWSLPAGWKPGDPIAPPPQKALEWLEPERSKTVFYGEAEYVPV
ncbi:MAG: hypothetical protein ACE5HI_07465, partial [bacterium]